MGVEAVRTGLIAEPRLLSLADSLGLQIFQELPNEHLSARALNNAMGYARRLLEQSLALSRDHASARHFGLARRSDTSNPHACTYFAPLVALAHAVPGVRVYYVSAFPDSDVCRGMVDFVLFDALDQAPRRSENAGLATLGTWIRKDAWHGLRKPHSPESQARFLETNLNAALADTSDLEAVFVHRWRDSQANEERAGPERPDPFGRLYGLYDKQGNPRPAQQVVAGIYSGRQRVFAFSAGTPTPSPWPWVIVLGWGVFALIGVYYQQSPGFRFTVPRYFFAHVFYREVVREGRDVLPAASGLIMVVLGVSMGLMGIVFVSAFQETQAVLLFLKSLGPAGREVIVGLLVHPWMLMLSIGSVYILGLSLWAAILALAAGGRGKLTPGQAFMLVVWPRWPFLVLLIMAMILSEEPQDTANGAIVLFIVWLVASMASIIRSLIDFANVTGAQLGRTMLVGLANPLIVVGLLVLFVALTLYRSQVGFFWHLLIRS